MTPSVAGITPEERAHVLRLLRDTETDFLELLAKLSESQWTWQPSSDRWSIQQTAEHLVLGEKGMLAKIREALANPASENWEEADAAKTMLLNRVIPVRVRKADAPAPLVPRHQWTKEQTIDRFRQGRLRTIQFAEEIDQPIKAHASEHPFPVFNTLNAYHWLLYIPLHNARHNQQISEILKESGL